MEILDRIVDLLGNREQKELTSYLGLKKSAFSDWKSGKSNSYRKYIMEISQFFNVSPEYILYGTKSINLSEQEQTLISLFNQLDDFEKGQIIGKAETLLEISKERKKDKEKPSKKPLNCLESVDIVVPLCELPVSAGTGIYLDGGSTEPLKVVRTAASEAANYALRVSGDSMEPEYSDGDIVLIETVEEISEGEIGIFIADGEGFMKVRGAAALISLNATYPPRSYASFESVKCIGRVLGKAELV